MVEDVKEFCGDMGSLMKNIMTDSATSFYNEHRLLKINEAQREYIDGNISREEMDSRIEMANQNYKVALLGQIESMKNSMQEYDLNRELKKFIDINKALKKTEKKGFFGRWKKSKH